ncbi:hypothetical protein WJX73_001197 [Symbiochloris irregularis]|uniref:F-box domain-containing protein n=1 Tax=Symbiochloris irregularis TaxID=706552 RepID=A0AAW1PHV5_9CHLO
MASAAQAASRSGAGAGQHMFTSPDFTDALVSRVLPLLSVRDLVALTCTCKGIRALLLQQQDLWQTACADNLPPEHPSLSGLTPTALQSLMQRRSEARMDIFKGQVRPSFRLGKFEGLAPIDKGLLVHAHTGCLTRVASGSGTYFQNRAFDRTGQLVGFGLCDSASGNWQGAAAIVETASGREILKVEKQSFVDFFTTRKQALFMRLPTAEIWDLVQCSRLYSIVIREKLYGSCLALDDNFICGFYPPWGDLGALHQG